MRPISELVPHGKPRQDDSPDASGLPEAWVRALFAKFQVRYGARWTSPLDDDAMCALAIAEWAHGLAGLSGEDIRRGLDAWDGAWPPSLPEFRAACSKPKQHAAHQLHRALPPPKRDPVVVADEIAKMREEIRK